MLAHNPQSERKVCRYRGIKAAARRRGSRSSNHSAEALGALQAHLVDATRVPDNSHSDTFNRACPEPVTRRGEVGVSAVGEQSTQPEGCPMERACRWETGQARSASLDEMGVGDTAGEARWAFTRPAWPCGLVICRTLSPTVFSAPGIGSRCGNKVGSEDARHRITARESFGRALHGSRSWT